MMSQGFTPKGLIVLPLIVLVALGACRDKPEEPKASASASASANANQPGMKIEVIDPDVNLKADDFNIDGVKLYAGSTITEMNVETSADTSKGGKSTVKIGFNSPANAKVVADWFEAEMKKAKFETARSGYNISGKTSDGSEFKLLIDDLGGGRSVGTVDVIKK